MSGQKLFDLCSFKSDESDYLSALNSCLKEVPATITTRDVELATNRPDLEQIDSGETGTSPLHMIVQSIDPAASGEKLQLAEKMVEKLFQYGANWMMIDDNNETPGCIALRRDIPRSIYDLIVQAGFRSEIFLRKMTEPSDDEHDDDGHEDGHGADPSADQKAYLNSKLEYNDSSLITTNHKDGVMMEWETPIMKKSAQLITCNDKVVLNVGFGMGIIDNCIQELNPTRHYICEAHPDVLRHMKETGWYNKPNVTILEGRWQDCVDDLIQKQIYFDGIYYDTFSEHYKDLMEFYDAVVGLLKPTGIFSFFNGLGADRQVCYDVYKQVVEFDLANYGLGVDYQIIKVHDKGSEQIDQWNGIRYKYWQLDEYFLPIIRFQNGI